MNSSGDQGTGTREPGAASPTRSLRPAPGSPFPYRIALIAGEASGDLLGAGLANALRERLPQAQIAGVVGPSMRAAGVEPWHDCSELAVMGLVEVLRHLPRLLRLRRDLYRRLLAWRPDVVVGIDAPDFNLGLERRLKRAGIATAHYVSPSVWAWRAGRAARIGESAQRVLCLFPMEPPIYAQHGVRADFVGHPLAEQFDLQPDALAARQALGLAGAGPWLALLPGSRLGEIQRLSAPFLGAAALLRRAHPGLQVMAPMVNARCRAGFEGQLEAMLAAAPALASADVPSRDELLQLRAALHLIDGQSQRAMVAADVILLASGTAALEAMLAKRPLVVGYKIAPLTYALVKHTGLLRVDHYSLPNILAGEAVVPELMQAACTAPRLAQALAHWLRTPAAFQAVLPRFMDIHRELRRDASARAADVVLELLERHR